MKRLTKPLSLALAVILALSLLAIPAAAKTVPAGQTVGNVLFYATNSKGQEILISQISVAEMEADLKNGRIDATVHNYALLDKFVTTIHQEAQGFTVTDFLAYAQSKSTVASLRSLPLSWTGASRVWFWAIDDTGWKDDFENYTYADLYGVQRYNFPALYEQWDYNTQAYKNVDAIWASRQPETVLLSVRAFSQRYMLTDAKFGSDYNMENYWNSLGLLDNERTLRIMLPMSESDLRNKVSTANNSRYWVSNVKLSMANAPAFEPLGTVSAPTAVMTEYGDNYYVRLSCATPGATILYNHNFISPSYTPTSPYGDTAVIIPKSDFKSGTVTLTARAVKEGYTDAGVVTLTLKSSGTEQNPNEGGGTYSDVNSGDWYYDAVNYVMGKNLFDLTGKNTFSPNDGTTRAVMVTALYRLAGSPAVYTYADIDDVPKGTPLSAAVSWAYANGITNGTGGNNYSPDVIVDREQMATYFYRFARYLGANVSARGDLSRFPDRGNISDYALEPLSWAVAVGVINGMGDGAGGLTMSPKYQLSRGMIAQIFYNYSRI